jgi:putative phosphoribosyl transferase
MFLLFADEVKPLFRNREDAGQKLASRLSAYRAEAPLVLAATPGAVLVASEVARRLDAELGLWLVLELSGGLLPELVVGGVAESGMSVVDHTVSSIVGITPARLRSLREEVTPMWTRAIAH